MRRHPGEVLVEGEEAAALGDGLRGDEAVGGGGRDAGAAAGVRDPGGLEVMDPEGEEEGEPLDEAEETLGFGVRADPGEDFLEGDSGDRDGLVLLDHPPEAFHLGRFRDAYPAPPEGGGEDRGVEDCHRFFRARL